VVLAEAQRPWQRWAAGAAFLCPAVGMAAAHWSVPLIPLALLGLALAQWRQLRRPPSEPDCEPADPFKRPTAAFG
jgi:hypothetical protein